MAAAVDRTRAERFAEMATAASCVYFGPHIGEFAFELMDAAVARRDARGGRYAEVIVCSRADREALHADYCTKFVPHDIDCKGVCALAEPMVPGPVLERWIPRAANVHIVRPRNCGHRLWAGDYIVYGQSDPQWAGAIVMHARNRPHCQERNWPVGWWHKTARHLARRFPQRRLVCIGSPAHALGVEGCADLRAAGLQAQMNALRTAGETGGFAFGPSSGPMHLAEHCGCPVMVWCGGPEWEANCTKSLYERGWNPHNVRVATYCRGDWTPPFEDVRDWLDAFIG